MSRGSRSLIALSVSSAVIGVFSYSPAYGGVTLNSFGITSSANLPSYWPGQSTAVPSFVGTNPIYTSAQLTAPGNVPNAIPATNDTLADQNVEAQTFQAQQNFTLGAYSLLLNGGSFIAGENNGPDSNHVG